MKKKLQEELKQMIKEAVREALTVDLQWEKVRDEETGLPLKHPERRNEKVFLPSFMVQLLPYHEGALRGMQEIVDREVKNTVAFAEKVEAIGNILLGHEKNLIEFAKFVEHAKEQNMLGYEEEIEGEIIDEGSSG